MKLGFIEEPALEFFGGFRHVDIRYGLMDYGPIDLGADRAPQQIRIGLIGTPLTIENVKAWLKEAGSGLPAKASRQPNLFPPFPGFGDESPFRSSFVFDSRWERPIPENELIRVADHGQGGSTARAVHLFTRELSYLADEGQVDVAICALPLNLLEFMEADTGLDERDADDPEDLIEGPPNFRRMLKAQAMRYRIPLQIVLPTTVSDSVRRKQKRRAERPRELQDPATRAWNLHTALYYKAGGRPWRLCRQAADYTTCYVGVRFYHSLDNESVWTSVAQVFNERGEGVIVRGAPGVYSKEDRQTHLTREDSHSLLTNALELYRSEHGTLPARVVVHKSSRYNGDEHDGFNTAIRNARISSRDLLSFGRHEVRVFRPGEYPALRGTFLSLDDRDHVLYTRGSVNFFATYPGQYVPTPLAFRIEAADQPPIRLAEEILSLTKMNWNNTQFDGRLPITLRAALQVADILKYVGPTDPVAANYAFYM
jgi:hypothetical protein